jgi:phage terminase small subunit
MPRKSASSYVLPAIHPKPSLPRPSTDLAPEPLHVFNQLVATSPAGHFRASDAPLLETYATAIAQARRADRELAASGPVVGGRASPWLRVQADAARVIASLAMRLRLCPQARATARSTARGDGLVGVYELMVEDAAHEGR